MQQQSVKQLTHTLSTIDLDDLGHDLSLDYGNELQTIIEKASQLLTLTSTLNHKALAIKCIEGDQSVMKGFQ